MSQATEYLDNKLREIGKTIIPNAAIRAYTYNALGVDKMTNKDFTQDELNQLNDAYKLAQQRVNRHNNGYTKVLPDDYSGNVVKTTNNNYIRNVKENPMRMTVGSAWISPKGDVVSIKNGEAYKGDIYDFSPKVQSDPRYKLPYKMLQKFGTVVRGNSPAMILDLKLGEYNNGEI